MEIKNKYFITDEKIGEGASSEVLIGKEISTGELVAIKKINILEQVNSKKNKSYEKIIKNIENEISIMKQLDHPNILKYYDSEIINDIYYIVIEYCNLGTLKNVIEYNKKNLNSSKNELRREQNTRYLLNQLKDAICYLADKNFIHRDIKPMNILLKNNMKNGNDFYDVANIEVKLGDFGLARYYENNVDNLLDTICGSPLYMSPELINGKKYNFTTELWSFGIIMYELLHGFHPFNSNTLMELKSNLYNNINSRLDKSYTSQCIDLLEKLLNQNPNNRIVNNELLFHDWFSINLTTLKNNAITIPTNIPHNRRNIIYFPSNSLDTSFNLSKMKMNKINFRNYPRKNKPKYPISNPEELLIKKIDYSPILQNKKEIVIDKHLDNDNINNSNDIFNFDID